MAVNEEGRGGGNREVGGVSDDICLGQQSGFILNAKGKTLEGFWRSVGQ